MSMPPGRVWLALFLLAVPAFLRAQDDSSPYHQALLNYKGGHYDAAKLAIDQAQQLQPTDIAIAVLKGRILTELGAFDDGATLLRKFLTPTGPLEVQLALGDLFLRQRNFGAAANMYDQALDVKPNDPDIMLRLVYARINTSDLVTAGKYASRLKPLDPVNPAYYFAAAALAETSGNSTQADQDIETARTIYGITTVNRYLKTYLEVFSHKPATGGISARANPGTTNTPPVQGR